MLLLLLKTTLRERACNTIWNKAPIWIHGDFVVSNILIKDNKLSGIIDFGSTTMGNPDRDLIVSRTYLSSKIRDIVLSKIELDDKIWLRSRAWALWKATFELSHIADKNSPEALIQRQVIDEVINE